MATTPKRPTGKPVSTTTLVAVEPLEFTETRQGFAALSDFSARLAEFLERAEFLTKRSDETLERAKRLVAPTSAQEDEAIQLEAKRSNADLRETREHFDSITKPLTQLHRYFTGKRTRAEQPTEEATKIHNRFHQGWVTAERLRVERENEVRRLAAEAKAREEQRRELDKLEAAALAKEAASDALSERERRFVELATSGTEAAAAATQAGFADGFKAAARLMGSAKVQRAIAARMEAASIRQQAEAVRQEPIAVDFVPVEANITRAAGAKDRTTWTAVVDDADLLIAAAISGKHGIPRDVLKVDEVKLNEYARSLHHLIDKWPGVRAVSSTKVV